MSVPPRSVFCQFFVSCQDSCEPVIISGVMRITSPGPTSAPGPGGGEVSGSGSQALAAEFLLHGRADFVPLTLDDHVRVSPCKREWAMG